MAGPRYGYLTLILTFILGCHEGFVALWRTPASEPEIIFPYSIHSLPPVDRERLLDGIELDSRPELTRWLEDHLS